MAIPIKKKGVAANTFERAAAVYNSIPQEYWRKTNVDSHIENSVNDAIQNYMEKRNIKNSYEVSLLAGEVQTVEEIFKELAAEDLSLPEKIAPILASQVNKMNIRFKNFVTYLNDFTGYQNKIQRALNVTLRETKEESTPLYGSSLMPLGNTTEEDKL